MTVSRPVLSMVGVDIFDEEDDCDQKEYIKTTKGLLETSVWVSGYEFLQAPIQQGNRKSGPKIEG